MLNENVKSFTKFIYIVVIIYYKNVVENVENSVETIKRRGGLGFSFSVFVTCWVPGE